MSDISRHMSRLIEVIDAEGKGSRHTLAIATVKVDNECVAEVSVEPFSEEIAGVEYHDSPISIAIGRPFQL